jgi:hypothetical protein
MTAHLVRRLSLATVAVLGLLSSATTGAARAETEPVDSPATLSEAMVTFYARQSQLTVGEFAARHGEALTSLGLDPMALRDGVAPLPDRGDPFAALRNRISTSTNPVGQFSLEAAVIGQGSAWADALAVWAAGPREIELPSLGSVPSPTVAQNLPPEGFGTGVFLEQALTRLVVDHPGVFAQVRSAGVGSPAASQAWRESMLSAFTTINGDRSTTLFDPCSVAYLGSMASGSASVGRSVSGDRCNPCVVAGMYMHGQMGRLFNPESTSALFTPGDGFLPPAEWSSLPQWQRDTIAEQNPSLRSQLESSLNESALSGSACAGSRAAIDAAAPQVLPGIWSNLTR